MTREEIIEVLNLEDGTIFLEPLEIFNRGIIGCTGDNQHLIYSYNKLVEALAEDYRNNSNSDDKENDFIAEACDWLDYNTAREIPYMEADFRPILMLDLE